MPDAQQRQREEGDTFPGRTYAEVVLAPAYEQAKKELLGPMISVSKAHLIMLEEQGLIAEEDAAIIARALQDLDLKKLENGQYTGEFEDLFFEVEHELAQLGGETTGQLHLARSRNDMGIAIYRIVLRGKLLTLITSALELQERLIVFAEEHAETLMIGYTHTQQAQPTTVGHYIAAVSDSLSRDVRRLRAAYANCNRSSLGAAALTTTGFAISRERTAELLGFDETIANAYDAVSGADYVLEIALSVSLSAVNLGRFIQELLLWGTQEFAAIKVAAPYVQISSIMPQKRNPVSVEHLRSLLSSCVGDANTALSMVHNTPFGDIVDTEDDLQPYVWRSLRTLDSACRLLVRIIETLEVDREVLRLRAELSFATVTELADTLVRKEGLGFRTAHAIVAELVHKAVSSGLTVRELTVDGLDDAAKNIIGRPLSLTVEELRQALDPEHFVRIRSVLGGPSPGELRRALTVQTSAHKQAEEWAEQTRAQIDSKLNILDKILTERHR
ncbi:argininosuccinate lyase [Paenibacillus sp. PR3]|uniref:Argininosuccinate lyase n=1 Tax=Paenibacillus terricola TaxID=2763503 RepID=A0ABR8MTY3_9BACL|nr:argininosuccinate lyase [Paenibacillus terricola]MBD3919421.1 argininosuccinate lyase [Paenibacillus terricola]